MTSKLRKIRYHMGYAVLTLIILLVATLICLALNEFFTENNNVSIIYTLAVAVVASVTPGYFYGMAAALVSAVGVNYFFMLPYWAFDFTRTGYPITFFTLLLVSMAMSTLMTRYRQSAMDARLRASHADALYRMTNELLAAAEPLDLERIVTRWVYAMSGFPARFLSPGESVQEGEHALPVKNNQAEMIAVLDRGALEEDQALQSFLRLLTAQYSMVLELRAMSEERNRVAVEMETEKMRANLLRAISHDLRTPLTSISGASSVLLENEADLDATKRRQLTGDIRENAQWLTRIVENLLSVTRITDGPAAIKKQPELVEEVVAQAAAQIRRRFPEAKLEVRVPDEVVIAPMDAMLVEQVIINLVENSIYHGKRDLPIWIHADAEDEEVLFTIRDHGVGIDEQRVEQSLKGHIPTERSGGDKHRGMGIGLSLCASIVHAHGGNIWARNLPDGGAQFQFALPRGKK